MSLPLLRRASSQVLGQAWSKRVADDELGTIDSGEGSANKSDLRHPKRPGTMMYVPRPFCVCMSLSGAL